MTVLDPCEQVVVDRVETGAVDLVVVDSVAALVPKDEIDGTMGDMQVGMQARMMSKAMRNLTMVGSRSATTLIFINQIRQKIGVTFGPSEVTTGGNALKYYASVRLDVRRVGALKRDEEVVGNRTKVKVVKNKLAPPFRSVEFDIVYGRGISRAHEVLDIAESRGIVSKSGSWYSFGESRLGNGRENVVQALLADSALLERLADAVRGGPVWAEGEAEA